MRVQKREKNNKGFSMVELLVAVGIMSIIVTTVGYMMTTSSKTYSKLSTEAQLQSEAQLVANGISELGIDSIEAWDNITNGSPLNGNMDTATGKALVLNAKSKTDEKMYVIGRDTVENSLYLYEADYEGETQTLKSAFSKSLLGQYITDFTVDTSRVQNENVINFKLSYTKLGRTYTGDYQILMRNRAYADPDAITEDDEENQLRSLTLNPKLVYIDIQDGVATQYYKNNLTSTPYTISGGTGSIDFTATPIYTGTAPNNDSKWSLRSEDPRIFSMSSEEAQTSSLQINVPEGYSFKDSAVTDFDVVAEKESITKTAKIKIRIVRRVSLSTTSGISQWKTAYSSALYNGHEAAGAQGYANENGTITILADVNHQNAIPNLTWKLYRRPYDGVGDWVECTDPKYGSILQSVTTRTTNTITLGSLATNDTEFKVVATSVFDPTVSGEYIFGVLPSKGGSGDGFYSRGYYVNMNDYFTNVDNILQGNGGDNERNYVVSKILDMWFDGGSNFDKFPKEAFKWDAATQTLYIDYESFQYSSDQRAIFYSGFEININLRYIDINGNEQTYGVYKYPIKAVKVTPLGASTLCLQKGRSQEINANLSYYNVKERKLFGLYVQESGDSDFTNNLNREGYESTDKYLTTQVSSSYGDVNTFVDDVSVNITAKTSSNDYPLNAITVRATADDYYNVTKRSNANAYYDYKVYIANVESMGVFFAGPETTKTSSSSSSIGWPTSVATSSARATTVTGINTSGNTVTAKVYQDGKKYKLIYGANTYTYNTTYNYWQK